MSLRTPDFESGAYTNFATPALRSAHNSLRVPQRQLLSHNRQLIRRVSLKTKLFDSSSVWRRLAVRDFEMTAQRRLSSSWRLGSSQLLSVNLQNERLNVDVKTCLPIRW